MAKITREDFKRGFMFRPTRPSNDPSASQSAEEIAAYYLGAKIGDQAVIRETQFHLLKLTLTTIDNINERKGRLYVKDSATFGGSAFYRKSGKNCFAPKGQTSLVVPTPEVLQWIEVNPEGLHDWA